MCDATYRLKAKLANCIQGQVTIHDILTFQCWVCGHGQMNRAVTSKGEVVRIYDHKGDECRTECCGSFLDRRYLQREGGNCECGILLMEKLGIRPATDAEHGWRKALYDSKPSPTFKRNVRKFLEPHLSKLGINKAQMIYWYITSQGRHYLFKLKKQEPRAVEAVIWDVCWRLRAEFGVHMPIQ